MPIHNRHRDRATNASKDNLSLWLHRVPSTAFGWRVEQAPIQTGSASVAQTLPTYSIYWPVWPDKNRQMYIKVVQIWFQKKNEWFSNLYRNCLTMWMILANCCHRLWMVTQSAKNRPIWSHCYWPTKCWHKIFLASQDAHIFISNCCLLQFGKPNQLAWSVCKLDRGR